MTNNTNYCKSRNNTNNTIFVILGTIIVVLILALAAFILIFTLKPATKDNLPVSPTTQVSSQVEVPEVKEATLPVSAPIEKLPDFYHSLEIENGKLSFAESKNGFSLGKFVSLTTDTFKAAVESSLKGIPKDEKILLIFDGNSQGFVSQDEAFTKISTYMNDFDKKVNTPSNTTVAPDNASTNTNSNSTTSTTINGHLFTFETVNGVTTIYETDSNGKKIAVGSK